MNYIWCGMVIISFAAAIINGRVEETVMSMFEGASMSVNTLLAFAGTMCFWTGILKVAEKSGASEKLQKILSPVIKRLFPKSGDKALKYITMNVSANILGMGNAATPMGIKAMNELDIENNYKSHASNAMCMFVVLNTTSFQLIPTTIISLRSAMGASNPFSIIVPVWIASAVSVTAAVIITKIVCRCGVNKQ